MSAYQDIQAARLGRDGVLPGSDKPVQPTASGDWPTIEGRSNLVAAMVRRATTSPGQMVHRPLYGGGLPSFIEDLGDPATLARQDIAIRQNALRDERVQEVVANTAESDIAGRVITTIVITPRGEDTVETATLVQE